MFITESSNEDKVVLEIIHEKIKFSVLNIYLDIKEQIENSFTNIGEILSFAKGT